ncbi:PD-(D/E)XK nuclease family protein [Brevibacillus sp. SYSU BS000544]|uniref:PD-(D/E)XK nuclease family protein n=1 Tax=Brevibacillus sp. SYSU BS000544 TaxID=3416443 RepID=UPI003CE4D778
MERYDQWIKKIETLSSLLQNQPLFVLSLSSKELFHSNFWKWLITVGEHQVLSIFELDSLNYKGRITPEREKYKIDLTIETNSEPDNVAYIENKVKSIPNLQQLNRYNKDLNNKKNKKLKDYRLITLFEPLPYIRHEINGQGIWKIISYLELAKSLEKVNLKNRYHQKLLKDYRIVIKCLSELSNALINSPNRKKLDIVRDSNMPLKILGEIGLDDIYIKYRSNEITHYLYDLFLKIRDKLIKRYPDDPFWQVTVEYEYTKSDKYYLDKKENWIKNLPDDCILIDWGYNNKNGTLDFSLKITDEILMGIQIEGGQYRKFIYCQKNCTKYAEAIIKNTKDVWFDKTWKSKKKREQFLKYDSTFRYQYDYSNHLTKETTNREIAKRILLDLKSLFDHRQVIRDAILKL